MKISERLNQQASLLHERAGDIAALEREHERLRAEVQRLADNLVHEANGCRGTVESITKREDSKRLRALLGEDGE